MAPSRVPHRDATSAPRQSISIYGINTCASSISEPKSPLVSATAQSIHSGIVGAAPNAARRATPRAAPRRASKCSRARKVPARPVPVKTFHRWQERVRAKADHGVHGCRPDGLHRHARPCARAAPQSQARPEDRARRPRAPARRGQELNSSCQRPPPVPMNSEFFAGAARRRSSAVSRTSPRSKVQRCWSEPHVDECRR